jgi:CDP-glucose 4,6-dehydratase
MWMKPGSFDEAWNFGPSHAGHVETAEIVARVIHLWGEGTWQDLSQCQAASSHEAQYLKLDCTKASSLLGWAPVLNLSEALAKTIDWYLQRHRVPDSDVRAYTIRQIEQYVQSAMAQEAVWTVKSRDT